jgi:hypothetical protein
MVDSASLNTTTIETVNRFHNFAKNIETAHLGNLYTTVIDGLDYYVVECAAKPLLANAPEWLSDNRVVSPIKDNKGLAILVGGIITLIFIIIMLHPKGGAPKPTGPVLKGTTPVPSDKERDSNTEKTGDAAKKKDSDETKDATDTKEVKKRDRKEKESDSDIEDVGSDVERDVNILKTTGNRVGEIDDGTVLSLSGEEEDVNKIKTTIEIEIGETT